MHDVKYPQVQVRINPHDSFGIIANVVHALRTQVGDEAAAAFRDDVAELGGNAGLVRLAYKTVTVLS